MSGFVLQTDRLNLRRFRPEDVDVLARWQADPAFRRHLGSGPQTREETAAALARYERHWAEHGFGLLAADDRASGLLVGRTGVQYHRAWADDPEVGWAFDPARWGQGLATEAGAASVASAFGPLGFARVVSITVAENAASRRVMSKLGFRLLAQRDSPHGVLLVHALDKPLS